MKLEDGRYYRAVDGTVTQVFKLKNPVHRLGVEFTFSGSKEPHAHAAVCYTSNGICFASSESYSGFNLTAEFNPQLSCGVHFSELVATTPLRDGSVVISDDLHKYIINLITRAARHIPL